MKVFFMKVNGGSGRVGFFVCIKDLKTCEKSCLRLDVIDYDLESLERVDFR